MEKIFAALKEQMDQHNNCMLITIVESSGSMPRTAGAYMVANEKGRVTGTIGGGLMEHQATLAATRWIQEKRSALEEYHLEAEAAASIGMVCGGKGKVLFYYLDCENEEDQTFVEEGIALSTKKEPYWMLLPLQGGKGKFYTDLVQKKNHMILHEEEKTFYAEKFAYDGKVYIFGGGHLAQEVVPVLSHLGFRCVVIDDREEFTRKELFPGAEAVYMEDFKQLDGKFSIKKEDYVAVMTRGHLCDLDVEKYVLKTEASYIGVVGSRRKTQFVRGKLREAGFSEEEMDRIVTPIGLDIGGDTPAEIAISIAAQLIQVRNRKFH